MFGKLRARTLVIALLLLAAIWFVSDRFSMNAQERTFRSEVLTLDTAAVSRITMHPRKLQQQPLVLERTGAAWSVSQQGRAFAADPAAVQALLQQFDTLRSKRMAGKLDAVRDRYELNDSLVNRVEFTLASGSTSTILIGKSTYAPANGGMWSYVNIPGEQEVYAVEGSLNALVDQDMTGFRPRTLVKGDPAGWQRLTFTYPADTGYVLERNGREWLVDGMPGDTTKINNYLKSVALSRLQSFADSAVVSGPPLYALRIEDSARPEPIIVQVFGWKGLYVATSSLNPGNTMMMDALREVPRFFRARHNWFVQNGS